MKKKVKKSIGKISRSTAAQAVKTKNSSRKGEETKKKGLSKKNPAPRKVESVKKPVSKKKQVLKKEPVPKKNQKQGSKSVQAEIPPFRFIPEKMDLVRQTLITILWRREALTAERLKEEAVQELASQFDDDFPMYFEEAIAVLGKYSLIEAVPDKKPLHIRLSQRLDG